MQKIIFILWVNLSDLKLFKISRVIQMIALKLFAFSFMKKTTIREQLKRFSMLKIVH